MQSSTCHSGPSGLLCRLTHQLTLDPGSVLFADAPKYSVPSSTEVFRTINATRGGHPNNSLKRSKRGLRSSRKPSNPCKPCPLGRFSRPESYTTRQSLQRVSGAPRDTQHLYLDVLPVQFFGLFRGSRHLSESHPAGPASVSSPWS